MKTKVIHVKECIEQIGSIKGLLGKGWSSTEYVDDKYAISLDDRPYSLVKVYTEKNTGRKVAFLGEANWGQALIFPVSVLRNLDVLTTNGSSCPFIYMLAKDVAGELQVIITHMRNTEYSESRLKKGYLPLLEQMERFVLVLKEKNLEPLEVNLNAFENTPIMDIFTTYLEGYNSTPKVVIRKKDITSDLLVTINGWILKNKIVTMDVFSGISTKFVNFQQEPWQNNLAKTRNALSISKPAFGEVVYDLLSLLSIKKEGSPARFDEVVVDMEKELVLVKVNDNTYLLNIKEDKIIKLSFDKNMYGYFFSLVKSKELVIVGDSYNNKLLLYNLLTDTVEEVSLPGNPVAISNDASKVLVAYRKRDSRHSDVFDIQTKQIVQRINDKHLGLGVSVIGNKYVGIAEEYLRVYSIENKKRIIRVLAGNDYINSISMNDTETQIAVGDFFGMIRVFNIKTGAVEFTHNNGTGIVDLFFHNNELYTLGFDGVIRKYKI
jgi:hypothetical protein